MPRWKRWTPKESSCEGERIQTKNVFWAAGVKGSPAAQWLGAEADRAGRVKVLPDCSVPAHPEIFVVGDTASHEEGGKPLPGVAQVAIQQGRYVGRLIAGRLDGEPAHGEPAPPAFKYFNKGNLATVGRNFAVMEAFGVRTAGLFAKLVWAFVHIQFLVLTSSRIGTIFRWTWKLLTRQRLAGSSSSRNFRGTSSRRPSTTVSKPTGKLRGPGQTRANGRQSHDPTIQESPRAGSCAMKKRGERIVMLTAYDATMARLLDRAGIDVLLVGDSLGNVILGLDTTIPVSLDAVIHHTRAVTRGASRALVVADMPFLTYQVSAEEALRNAARLFQEGGRRRREAGRRTLRGRCGSQAHGGRPPGHGTPRADASARPSPWGDAAAGTRGRSGAGTDPRRGSRSKTPERLPSSSRRSRMPLRRP